MNTYIYIYWAFYVCPSLHLFSESQICLSSCHVHSCPGLLRTLWLLLCNTQWYTGRIRGCLLKGSETPSTQQLQAWIHISHPKPVLPVSHIKVWSLLHTHKQGPDQRPTPGFLLLFFLYPEYSLGLSSDHLLLTWLLTGSLISALSSLLPTSTPELKQRSITCQLKTTASPFLR